jgi:tRNA A-37 threonylcarbamoyl transferase component Bud32
MRREVNEQAGDGRFVALTRSGWRGLAVAGAEAEDLARRLEPFAPGGRILQATPRSQVCELRLAERHYVVKEFLDAGPVGFAKRICRGSRARRAWAHLHRLRRLALPVPRPLLYLEEPWWSMRRRSLLVREHVDAPHARAFLAATPVGDARRALLIAELARAIRAMHDARLCHRDLKAENILVLDGRPVLIDLDGLRRVRHQRLALVGRDLGRLNASLLHEASLRERLRFLELYGCEGTWSRRALRSAVARATAAKLSLARARQRA